MRFNVGELIRGRGGCFGEFDRFVISDNAIVALLGNAIAVPGLARHIMVHGMDACGTRLLSSTMQTRVAIVPLHMQPLISCRIASSPSLML